MLNAPDGQVGPPGSPRTTERERRIRMSGDFVVPRWLRVFFPISVTVVCALLVPAATSPRCAECEKPADVREDSNGAEIPWPFAGRPGLVMSMLFGFGSHPFLVLPTNQRTTSK